MIAATRYGKIEGVKEGQAYVFKGIPYAKPPVGPLRFRAPEKPEPFSGIFRADTYGGRTMQEEVEEGAEFGHSYYKEFYNEDTFRTPVSEDGLYLNIWTPESEPEEKLPVLFYIHGGGFLGGTGHEMEFRTDAYARKNVILVTINYRLGILGYMAHKWLQQEDELVCGNYGVLDQIAALEWVKENISAFGGDPEKVTICGQSAGGMSVLTLMNTRQADGLYRGVIAQSAGGYPQLVKPMNTLDEAFQMGAEAVSLLGVQSIQELRAIPAGKFLEVQKQIVGNYIRKTGYLPYGPVCNQTLITQSLEQAVSSGYFPAVPVMIGWTRNDITITAEEAQTEESRLKQSCIGWSHINEEQKQNPAWVYYFRRDLPGDNAGAFHSAELWYMFGTLEASWRPFTQADYRLSDEMMDYWCNFVRTGNPNGEGVDEWKVCTKQAPEVKVFDIEEEDDK